MPESDEGQKADQRPKKYLWLGYGNYGGQPTRQIGGGNIRDPGLFEELFRDPKISSMSCVLYAASALIGLTVLIMLLAWGVSLVVR